MTERFADPSGADRPRAERPLTTQLPPAPAYGPQVAPMLVPAKRPLYWRMLRLRHLRPNGWQRAVLVEGVLAVAVTLVLADVASAWTLLALPLGSVIVVKAHDILTGMLRSGDRR